MLTPRQELLLGKVIEEFNATGQPVGSKALAADPEVTAGPSTVRNELSALEELGLLAHPHTSAGRVPTDAGYRYFVDRLLPATAEVEVLARVETPERAVGRLSHHLHSLSMVRIDPDMDYLRRAVAAYRGELRRERDQAAAEKG